MSCRLCADEKTFTLMDFGAQPIAHHFLSFPDQEDPKYAVQLTACQSCGLIQLQDPLPPEFFYTNYVTLSSWKAQPHLQKVLDLVTDLAGSKCANILEIGSNDGGFLECLLSRGYSKAVGIEPAEDAIKASRDRNVVAVHGYFDSHSARELVTQRGLFDVIVARQVLEHISDLRSFAQSVNSSLRLGGALVIEVPDFDFCLDCLDYSAVWEEHSNYFTSGPLFRFFALCGAKTVQQQSVVFSGQAKIAWARKKDEGPLAPGEFDLLSTLERIAGYRDRWPIFRKNLRTSLEQEKSAGGTIAVYGAGCRGCSLVNYSSVGDLVDFFVDDQSEKQGRYMPGSRCPILPSNVLTEKNATLCLLAVNGENESRVLDRLAPLIAQGMKVASLLPPSDCLLPVWPR